MAGAVDIPYADELPPTLLLGYALNSPSSPSDALYVRIPSLSQTQRISANWQPHGGTYPITDTPCLCGFDDAGGCWVLQWVGGWS